MSFISFIVKSPTRVTQLAATTVAAVGGGIISAKAAARIFPKRMKGGDPVPNNEDEGPLFRDKEDDEVDGDV